jgi:putative ABC transport system permease protein
MKATLRTLAHHRGYVLLSAFTIALAIGANLVVFTIVNAIWLRSRAIPRADRVVMVLGQNDLQATSEGHFWAARGLECFVRNQPVFQHVAGQVPTSGENAEHEPHIAIDRIGREVETIGVTWHYFKVIGAPARGRDFTEDDDRRGAEPVAIISERVWRDGFGADPGIIGSVLAASPRPIRIVGIAPPDFHGARLGERADMWVPAAVVPQVARPGVTTNEQPLLALARLKDGVSLVEAQRVMDEGENACGMPRSSSVRPRQAVIPIADVYGGPQSRTIVTRESGALVVVAVTAGLVLVGGCATLMALVLMHFERRRQELAVRIALGSSRLDLVRGLAVELAWIGCAGLIGAVGVTLWALGALPSLAFTSGVDFSRLDLALDWRVLAVGVLGTALTLTLASALPLRRSTRTDVALELVSSSSRTTPSSLRVRRTMMAVHAAATVIVLVGAGLFLRTVQVAFHRGAGFDLDRTLFVTAQVASNRMTREQSDARETIVAARAARTQGLLDAIKQTPGVSIATVGRPPVGLDEAARASRAKALETGSGRHELRFGGTGGGPGYLEALRVPILAGRSLTADDAVPFNNAGQARPAVVTASLARALWPGESPVGQRFKSFDQPHEVVGVAADFAQGSLRLDQRAGLITAQDVPMAARPFTLHLTIGAETDAAGLIRPVRQALTEAFPQAMRVDVATGRDLVARDLGRERLGASFFSGFGALALGLGLAGIFGLVAYHAESRRRDLGVRLALGATPRGLIAETVVIGTTPVVVGTGAGLIIAAIGARAVGATFFGVSAIDPLTYALVGTALVGGAVLAAISAARRVTRISPMDALRAL